MPSLYAALLVLLLTAWPGLPAQADTPLPGSPLSYANQTEQALFPSSPHRKPGGGKWRLGYIEGGDYPEYPALLRAIVQGLQDLGWLSLPPMPEDLNSRQMWDFLATNTHSDTLEFVADAWWQPGNFDAPRRPAIREAIRQRLQQQHDIDLILALGTWAGQDMAALGAPVPTVVASASDAVAAGIVHSAEDSGMDNLHAQVQPDSYRRQLQLFFDIVRFRSLGIVYEDSLEGRTYAAVSTAEEMGQKNGFRVQSCTTRSLGLDKSQASQEILACYRQLSHDVDAVYVTTHTRLTSENIGEIATMLRQAKVPSFAMQDSSQVRAGLLMSLAQANYSHLGLFHAEVIARIFNGAQPRQLNQIWVEPTKIALNLDTALAIGFDPPVDILLASDEVYRSPDQP